MNVFAARPATPSRAEAPARPRAQAVPRQAACRASPTARAMLSEVLAHLSAVERPVLQIVAAAPGVDAGRVARDLAVAASGVGRTLLVSATSAEAPDESGARELSWRLTGMLGGADGEAITPDVLTAGLYHARLPRLSQGSAAAPVSAWLAARQDFRVLVIETPAAIDDPRTLATAPLCHATVLAVSAGITRSDEVTAAIRQLKAAGASVLGTVLVEAPRLAGASGRFARPTGGPSGLA